MLVTSKSQGGLGFAGIGFASSRRTKLVQDELLSDDWGGGARRVNDWDAIDVGVRNETIDKRTHVYGGDRLAGEASARAILKSLKGLKAQNPIRAYAEGAEQIFMLSFRSGKSPPPTPKHTLPMSTWSELVIMTKGDPELLEKYLVNKSDVDFLRTQRHRFPRWLYLDWLTNRLTPTVASFWGAASDVVKYVSDLCRDDWRPIPVGRVKTEVVRGMMLFEEILSINRYSPYLLSFGG
jgi:hypothetical protein